MTLTPSSEADTLEALAPIISEEAADLEATAELDLAIPEEVPSADDSSSRVSPRDGDGVGFTLD